MQRGERIHLERDEHVLQGVAKDLLLASAYTAGLGAWKSAPSGSMQHPYCFAYSSCAIFCFFIYFFFWFLHFKIKKPCKEKKHRRYRGRLGSYSRPRYSRWCQEGWDPAHTTKYINLGASMKASVSVGCLSSQPRQRRHPWYNSAGKSWVCRATADALRYAAGLQLSFQRNTEMCPLTPLSW